VSRYTYAGPFTNPTLGWQAIENPDTSVGGWVVGIPITNDEIVSLMRHDVRAASELLALKDQTGGYRLHTAGKVFKGEDAEDQAMEYINDLEQFFEEDYDQYLEENSHEICRMERYEQWRNEY
jgi:hypothetical protein